MPIREGEKVSDEHLSIHDDLRKSPQKYDFYDELTDVFHRTTVGAYRIRPDVSENETNTYPNIASISTEQV